MAFEDLDKAADDAKESIDKGTESAKRELTK